MKFYTLKPEVPGSIFGETSIIDISVEPINIIRLDFRFDGWLGDDLLTSTPAYIVTKRLKDALLEINPTGVEFAEMTTSKSEQFEEIYPNRQLPEFFWLKISGRAGVADFGLFDKAKIIVAGKEMRGTRLTVSERVLDVMRSFKLDNCEIETFTPEFTTV